MLHVILQGTTISGNLPGNLWPPGTLGGPRNTQPMSLLAQGTVCTRMVAVSGAIRNLRTCYSHLKTQINISTGQGEEKEEEEKDLSASPFVDVELQFKSLSRANSPSWISIFNLPWPWNGKKGKHRRLKLPPPPPPTLYTGLHLMEREVEEEFVASSLLCCFFFPCSHCDTPHGIEGREWEEQE